MVNDDYVGDDNDDHVDDDIEMMVMKITTKTLMTKVVMNDIVDYDVENDVGDVW